jgi:hypothetical protein
VTGDDLKRMQDNLLENGKMILRESGRLHPIGFVVTLDKHVGKLVESGWGAEFINPNNTYVPLGDGDKVATLVLDLLMDWKRLYHAVLNVYPKTRSILPGLIAVAETCKVDDPYKRTMRPFLKAAQLDEKDVIAATMRQVCDKVDAFACIMQTEAWMRYMEPSEEAGDVTGSLEHDKKSIEVVISSMETYDFARMLTQPIHRETSAKKRDEGKVLGFGDRTESLDTADDKHVLEGRFVRFLKPLKEAS